VVEGGHWQITVGRAKKAATIRVILKRGHTSCIDSIAHLSSSK
jgi:hypothetical protein